jgi:tetratricopeptide (TPR) repeat protein
VAGLLKNRGWAQLLLGDYGLAGQDLARAIHLNPDRPDLYFLTAQLLEKQGKMAEALPYWRQGLALSNLNPPPSDLPEQVQWHNQAGLKIRNAP